MLELLQALPRRFLTLRNVSRNDQLGARHWPAAGDPDCLLGIVTKDQQRICPSEIAASPVSYNWTFPAFFALGVGCKPSHWTDRQSRSG